MWVQIKYGSLRGHPVRLALRGSGEAYRTGANRRFNVELNPRARASERYQAPGERAVLVMLATIPPLGKVRCTTLATNSWPGAASTPCCRSPANVRPR